MLVSALHPASGGWAAIAAAAAAPSAATGAPVGLLAQIQANLAAKTALWSKLVDAGGDLAVNIAISLVILLATIWAAGWAARLTSRGFAGLAHRRGIDPTLQAFAASLTRNLVLIIGLIAVLQQLGVRTTSIIAVLGAGSLAIGLALQGALANVAAGVLILMLRPFRVGERVQIAGKEGLVRAVDLFNTELADPDNVRVTVPNSKAFGEVIVNYSRTLNRRIELKYGIDYDDDVDAALALMLATAKADARVLASPEPWAKLTALGDSSQTITLRAWVAPDDWWDARFDLMKAVKDALAAAQMHFPYPHQVALTRAEAHLDHAAGPDRQPQPRPQ